MNNGQLKMNKRIAKNKNCLCKAEEDEQKTINGLLEPGN
jgi:hypothetical protein